MAHFDKKIETIRQRDLQPMPPQSYTIPLGIGDVFTALRKVVTEKK